MSKAYREAGSNGRVKQFCERCGRVSGPIWMFGEEVGEIVVSATTAGSYCQDCRPVQVHSRPAVAQVARVSVQRRKRSTVDLSSVLAYIETL